MTNYKFIVILIIGVLIGLIAYHLYEESQEENSVRIETPFEVEVDGETEDLDFEFGIGE